MRKLICVLMTLVLLLSLAACGGAETPPAADNTPSDTTPTEGVKPEEAFFLVSEGVKLIPGKAFDPSLLLEPIDTYEVPSCAIEGTDNVYCYDAFELTAYNDGTGEVIYSIYLLDPNVPTEEGLYLGDDLATVEKLYGTDYADNDGELVFTKGATELHFIMEDDLVASVEYRMVTE